MTIFKVGDKVKIRKDLVLERRYDGNETESGVNVNSEMMRLLGMDAIITKVFTLSYGETGYHIDIETGWKHTWTKSMLVNYNCDIEEYRSNF